MAKAPEIGPFGAAIPPDAEVKHADDDLATFRANARIADVIAFYEAVYGPTEGLDVAANRDADPISVCVTSGPKCPDAQFAMITAVAVPKEAKQVDIVITRREDEEEDDYPDSSPWAEPEGPPPAT